MATIIALGLHLTLLALILAWRSPPLHAGYEGVNVSLFPSTGINARGASKSVERVAVTPAKAEPSVSTSPLSTEVMGSSLTLQERPKFDPPTDLQPILINPLTGAPPASTGVGKALAADTTTPPASAAAGTPTRSCTIYDSLQAILQTSTEVRSALNLIPVKSRSVANAVLLWDGRWVNADTVGGELALGPVRAAVVKSIGQASVSCQEELVRGPRVITIGDAKNTIVLAFGSGEWRWADLIVNAGTPQSFE